MCKKKEVVFVSDIIHILKKHLILLRINNLMRYKIFEDKKIEVLKIREKRLQKLDLLIFYQKMFYAIVILTSLLILSFKL